MEYFIIGLVTTLVGIVSVAVIGIFTSANRTIKNLAEMDREERKFKRAVLKGEMRLNDMRVLIMEAQNGYIDWFILDKLHDLTNEEFDNWYEQYLSTGETTIEI